jgi:hypothetical protein
MSHDIENDPCIIFASHYEADYDKLDRAVLRDEIDIRPAAQGLAWERVDRSDYEKAELYVKSSGR